MHILHSVARRRTDPLRVLVADDEPQICEFVSRILSDAGYQVTTADNGPAAIAAVTKQGAPDLLLTDFKMPQMDGDELAARLRQSWPDLKVLYLTGYSQALFDNRPPVGRRGFSGEAMQPRGTARCRLDAPLQSHLSHCGRAAAGSSDPLAPDRPGEEFSQGRCIIVWQSRTSTANPK
jgi:CheY-like chemotaxis protein